MEDIRRKDLAAITSDMGNVLETVTIPNYPVIAEIKEYMMEHGAAGAMMSGSGPTVFGLFDDKEKAVAAYEAMQASDWQKAGLPDQYLQQHEISEEMEENRFMTDDLTLNMDAHLPLGMWCLTHCVRQILKRRVKTRRASDGTAACWLGEPYTDP